MRNNTPKCGTFSRKCGTSSWKCVFFLGNVWCFLQNVGYFLRDVWDILGNVGLLLGNVGLFLGNVGCFLGIVRHCAEEKFEVRVRVCCGGNLMCYKPWILPFVLLLTRARARISQEFYAFYCHICHRFIIKWCFSGWYGAVKWNLTKRQWWSHFFSLWQQIILRVTANDSSCDSNRSSCDSKLFSLWQQIKGMLSLVSPPLLFVSGQWGSGVTEVTAKNTKSLGYTRVYAWESILQTREKAYHKRVRKHTINTWESIL